MAETFPLPQAPPRGNVFPPQLSPTPNAGSEPLRNAQPNDAALASAQAASNGPSAPPSSHQALGEQADADAGSRAATPRPMTKPVKNRSPPHLTIQTGAPRPSQTPSTDSRSSSVTLGREGDEQQTVQEETPVMRSMFPSVAAASTMPLQHIQGPPRQITTGIMGLTGPLPPPPALHQAAHGYSPSMYSQASPPPFNSIELQSIHGSEAPRYSTIVSADEFMPTLSAPDDLVDLWVIASGQLGQEARDTYTLGLQCDSLFPEREQMHFTSSTGPIYSLKADGKATVLSRSHPLNARQSVTISTPTLQSPSPHSPVLATITPTLAELIAADRASSLASSHRAASTSLQAAALSRVQATESASVLYDSATGCYHCTMPGTAAGSRPLPVTISAGQCISLSTSHAQPLLTLNLHEATLAVRPSAISALSASPHSLDLAVSALLTLLLHLHRHTSLLLPGSAAHDDIPHDIPHFDPPPTFASSSSLGARSSRRAKAPGKPPGKPPGKHPRWLSLRQHRRLPETDPLSGLASPVPAALRSPAFSAYSTYSSPYLGSSADPKDIEAAVAVAAVRSTLSVPIGPALLANELPALPARGVAPELRRDVTGVDLSRFQAYDLSDPEIGAMTRTLLRLLYWAFGVLVWVLGVGVGVIAATVVALGGLGGARESARVEGREKRGSRREA